MWLKVAVSALVVVEWLLIVLIGGLALWAFFAWIVPGQCTGIACW